MPGFLEDLQKLHYGGDLTDIAQKISLEESRRALQKQALSRLGQVSKSIQSQQNPVAQAALPQVETLQSIASVPFMDTGTLQNVLMQSGQIESSVRGAILNSQINQQLVNSANTLSQHIQEQMNRLQQMSQNYKNLPPEQQGVWQGMLQQQLQTLGNLQAVYSNTVNMMKNLTNVLTPQEITQQIGGIDNEALQLLARSDDPTVVIRMLEALQRQQYENKSLAIREQTLKENTALKEQAMAEKAAQTAKSQRLAALKQQLHHAQQRLDNLQKNSFDQKEVDKAQQKVDALQQQIDELISVEDFTIPAPQPAHTTPKKQKGSAPSVDLNGIKNIQIIPKE